MAALSEDQREDVVKRLRRIEGQVRGIKGMVESDQYCIDILNQIAAANRALDQVALRVLDGHVRGCVRDALERGGPESDAKVEELLAAVERFSRTH